MVDLISVLLLAVATNIPAKPETRCGWIDNPTPANWWLVDKDGEWTISTQGGYQADGWEDGPDISGKDWVETNGSYGYGCGCLKVTVDRETMNITKIFSGKPLPLRTCRADKKLQKR